MTEKNKRPRFGIYCDHSGPCDCYKNKLGEKDLRCNCGTNMTCPIHNYEEAKPEYIGYEDLKTGKFIPKDLAEKLEAIETAGKEMIEAKKEIEIAKYEAEHAGLKVRPAETKYLQAKEEFNNF